MQEAKVDIAPPPRIAASHVASTPVAEGSIGPIFHRGHRSDFAVAEAKDGAVKSADVGKGKDSAGDSSEEDEENDESEFAGGGKEVESLAVVEPSGAFSSGSFALTAVATAGSSEATAKNFALNKADGTAVVIATGEAPGNSGSADISTRPGHVFDKHDAFTQQDVVMKSPGNSPPHLSGASKTIGGIIRGNAGIHNFADMVDRTLPAPNLAHVGDYTHQEQKEEIKIK